MVVFTRDDGMMGLFQQGSQVLLCSSGNYSAIDGEHDEGVGQQIRGAVMSIDA